MDRIELVGLRVFGRHGVLESERRDGQTFVVDVSLEIDLAPAGASDQLSDTVDYGSLAQRIAAAVADTQFRLLEALAAHLASLALGDPRVRAATVRVAKPDPPIRLELSDVAVTVRRERRAPQ
ncbi:MAG TPA: dihydroneopterin aldolase [Egibacteraceae bacterium]|nr:dihydroneopterin aldolase [Egibacteraceae bacterium]